MRWYWDKDFFRVFFFGLLLPGFLLLCLDAHIIYSRQQLLRHSLVAEGTIVESSEEDGASASITQFAANDGSTHFVVDQFSSLKVGEKVQVVYRESDPDHAIVKHFSALWGFATIVGIIGLVCLGIGSGMLYFGRLRTKPRVRRTVPGSLNSANRPAATQIRITVPPGIPQRRRRSRPPPGPVWKRYFPTRGNLPVFMLYVAFLLIGIRLLYEAIDELHGNLATPNTPHPWALPCMVAVMGLAFFSVAAFVLGYPAWERYRERRRRRAENGSGPLDGTPLDIRRGKRRN